MWKDKDGAFNTVAVAHPEKHFRKLRKFIFRLVETQGGEAVQRAIDELDELETGRPVGTARMSREREYRGVPLPQEVVEEALSMNPADVEQLVDAASARWRLDL